MTRVKVTIEEHLLKEIEVEVPNDIVDTEILKFAETQVYYDYKAEKIILSPDDFNGIRLMKAEYSGKSDDWFEF